MTNQLAKHGSEAGYNAELNTGNICERCRAAHRVWSRRKGKKGKAEGLGRYSSYDVIDHLDLRRNRPGIRPAPAPAVPRLSAIGTATAAPPPDRTPDAPPGPASGQPEPPSMRERLGSALGAVLGGPSIDDASPYVATEAPPDYLDPFADIEADPEPEDSDYYSDDKAEYVINAAGLAKIEENLGTYLSIVGMTGSMIDPYCGSVLADQLPVMVQKWAKVITHYPKAAELFLDGKGGVIFAWIAALQATWPVLLAFYHHHLARDVVIRDGRVFRKDGATRPGFDGTMPPMPDDFNYSAV